MKFLLAGWLSVVFALLWQRFLHRLNLGEQVRVGFLIPIGEEIVKYGMAMIFKTPVLAVYLVFGLGEGFYEALRSPDKSTIKLITAGVVTHFYWGRFLSSRFPPLLVWDLRSSLI